MALLEVEDLRTFFYTRHGVFKAVDGLSLQLERGETVGIVGESGSGKSVSCYSLLDLIPKPPGRIESGVARFDGVDLLNCSAEQMRQVRGKKISMIFQDPMTCLNPYLTIGDQLTEPLLVHDSISRFDAEVRAVKALEEVGIHGGAKRLQSYPHEFSGGMRQRVMIAMALITNPQILIADEPTTALDVTVQAQILDLIRRQQKEHGTAVIFVTHDLGVVASMANRILVMYAGKIAERGTAEEIFYHSKHPYTRALLASIPSTHQRGEELYTIRGLPPDVSRLGPGCAFEPRCDQAKPECKQPLGSAAEFSNSQRSLCIRAKELN